MVVPHNVFRIQGTMPGGEVWSVNPRFHDRPAGSIVDFDELLQWAEAIRSYIDALPANDALMSTMSAACAITNIRAEAINSEGQMIQAAEAVFSTPKVGIGTATKPFQTAIVASLLTGRPGRSYRGRLYWPALGVAISGSTLRVAPAVAQEFADAVADLLTAIGNAEPNGDGSTLVVVSQTRNVSTPVTQISVGDILDTQRRRRDAAEESRVTSAFPSIP